MFVLLNNFILLCRLRRWVDVPVASGAPLAPRDEAGATVVVRRGLEFLATREPVVADFLGHLWGEAKANRGGLGLVSLFVYFLLPDPSLQARVSLGPTTRHLPSTPLPSRSTISQAMEKWRHSHTTPHQPSVILKCHPARSSHRVGCVIKFGWFCLNLLKL